MEQELINKALAVKFYCDDLDKEVTVKGYLKIMLLTLWKQQECFNGKRPFGNSGWDHDVHVALVKAQVVNGSLDEDGYMDEHNYDETHKLILECIKSL